MPGAWLAAQPTQKPYGSIRLVPQIGLFMKEKKHASVLNALKVKDTNKTKIKMATITKKQSKKLKKCMK